MTVMKAPGEDDFMLGSGDTRVPAPLPNNSVSPPNPGEIAEVSEAGTIPPRNIIRPPLDYVPSAPDFVQQERGSALRTVREATRGEIQALYPRERLVVIRTQSGKVPQSESSWFTLMTTASCLDLPMKEAGEQARENRRGIIQMIQRVHQRLTVPPPVPLPVPEDPEHAADFSDYDFDASRIDDDRYLMSRSAPPGVPSFQWRMLNAPSRRETLVNLLAEWIETQSAPPAPPTDPYVPAPYVPDPAIVEQHERHLAMFPWITYYLGYRESPIPDPVEPEADEIEEESGPSHGAAGKDASEAMRITLKSLEKSKERVGRGEATMHAPWLEDTSLYMREILATIGPRPTTKTFRANGSWYYEMSLDCWPSLGHYGPGNVDWQDKTTQRLHRKRMQPPKENAS